MSACVDTTLNHVKSPIFGHFHPRKRQRHLVRQNINNGGPHSTEPLLRASSQTRDERVLPVASASLRGSSSGCQKRAKSIRMCSHVRRRNCFHTRAVVWLFPGVMGQTADRSARSQATVFQKGTHPGLDCFSLAGGQRLGPSRSVTESYQKVPRALRSSGLCPG